MPQMKYTVENWDDPPTEAQLGFDDAAHVIELRIKIQELRQALQDAQDLVAADAPTHMITDVCERALAVSS
jgi:hypothetical protein